MCDITRNNGGAMCVQKAMRCGISMLLPFSAANQIKLCTRFVTGSGEAFECFI